MIAAVFQKLWKKPACGGNLSKEEVKTTNIHPPAESISEKSIIRMKPHEGLLQQHIVYAREIQACKGRTGPIKRHPSPQQTNLVDENRKRPRRQRLSEAKSRRRPSGRYQGECCVHEVIVIEFVVVLLQELAQLLILRQQLNNKPVWGNERRRRPHASKLLLRILKGGALPHGRQLFGRESRRIRSERSPTTASHRFSRPGYNQRREGESRAIFCGVKKTRNMVHVPIAWNSRGVETHFVVVLVQNIQYIKVGH